MRERTFSRFKTYRSFYTITSFNSTFSFNTLFSGFVTFVKSNAKALSTGKPIKSALRPTGLPHLKSSQELRVNSLRRFL